MGTIHCCTNVSPEPEGPVPKVTRKATNEKANKETPVKQGDQSKIEPSLLVGQSMRSNQLSTAQASPDDKENMSTRSTILNLNMRDGTDPAYLIELIKALQKNKDDASG